jgi:hypothetical protein
MQTAGTSRVKCALIGLAGLLYFPMPSLPAELSSFAAGDSSWHLGTLTVGNLDTDPQLEIVVPYRNSAGQWFLDAFKWDGTRLSGFPYSSGGQEMNVSPTLVDLDGDGRDEIIFTRGNTVVALRGDGSLLWSTTISSANYVPNGGYQTVTNGFYWSGDPVPVLLPTLPATAVFSSQVSPPIIADFNGAGIREVLTGWKIDPDPTGALQDYNPFLNDIFGYAEWGTVGETWSGGAVFLDAASGQKNFVYHLHQLVEAGLAIGHADADRPLETYVLNDSDSVVCFDKSQPHGLWGKGMLHKQFGKNQQLMTGSYQFGIDVQTADIDGDGLDEVLVASTQWSDLLTAHETILDDDGAILWRQWKPRTNFVHKYGWLNNAVMIPVNPDHDNHVDVLSFTHSYEINFRWWNGAELVSRPGWPKNFYPYLPTPPVVGDIDGDGQEEIIIGTYHPSNIPSDGALQIFALDGRLKQSVPVPGGIKQIPFLADVNNDGSLDVVFRSTTGIVHVQNFGARPGASVSWATHRGNKEHDGLFASSLYPRGTPLVRKKASAYRSASFTWSADPGAQFFRIYRSESGNGPFTQVATTPGAVTNYTDLGLQNGTQYFYEIAAVYATNTPRSAPFVVTPFYNGNILANGTFEENDNSHWDKWFTGDIPAQNMTGATNQFYAGRASMEIRLQNHGNNSSISQFNQYGIPTASLPVAEGAFYSMGGFFKSGGISQPSEHWLEWSSTKTAFNTNSRPSLPWPYYFTPHFKADVSASPWTYVDRAFVLPLGFPNLEVRHRFTINSPGSGSVFLDNLFLRKLPAIADSRWVPLVPFGSNWRYVTSKPSSDWFTAEFNDSPWSLGQAKFGAGAATNVVTPLPQRQPNYYFRRTFVLTNSALEELLLAATCTDDYGGVNYPLDLYLNGRRIPASAIEITTGQGNETRYFDLVPFIDFLHPGTNVIAAAIGNAVASDFDDIAFDLALKGIITTNSVARISSVQRRADGVLLQSDTPAATIWRLQSSDQLSATNWQTFETFTNTTSSQRSTLDTGQAGRRPPSATQLRFYRLAPY